MAARSFSSIRFMHCEVCQLTWDEDGYIEDDRFVECPECGALTLSDYSLPEKQAEDEAC